MLKNAFAAAVFATLSASSYAAGPGPAYGGLDAGSTRIDSFSGRKTSFGGFLGYSFRGDIAVEAGYRHLGSWDIPGGNVKLDQAVLSVIGAWPLGERFSVFSRLGYNRLRAKANFPGSTGTGTTSGLMYGVGASFNVDQKASARIEFQKPASDTSNVSIGLIFRF